VGDPSNCAKTEGLCFVQHRLRRTWGGGEIKPFLYSGERTRGNVRKEGGGQNWDYGITPKMIEETEILDGDHFYSRVASGEKRHAASLKGDGEFWSCPVGKNLGAQT